MLLVVDIGNTNINFGLYDEKKMIFTSGFSHHRKADLVVFETLLSSLFSQYYVNNCIISSVADELTEVLYTAILKILQVKAVKLTSNLKVGIKIKTKNPENVGADRIANALAASRLYKERPIVVIDSGTATTFDVIDKEGNFVGGLIMPGMQMQLDALGSNTSKLPSIDIGSVKPIPNVISDDTMGNILSGVINGHAQAVQGLVVECERELQEKVFVIGTGGGIQLLDKYMKDRKIDVINKNLTLDGIKMIFELNI